MKVVGYLCLSGIITSVLNAAISFNDQAIDLIFKNEKSALIYFNNDESTTLEEFKSVAQKDQDGLIYTYTLQNDQSGHFTRLAEYVGANIQTLPSIVFYNPKQSLKYRLQTQINQESIKTFIRNVQDGSVQPFRKSAKAPESNDQPVKILVGDNFQQMVINSDKMVLVEFYAPWCGHCQKLAPQYQQAAKSLLESHPHVMIAKMDSTVNQVKGVKITGFPTLKFWGKDKSSPIDFSGQRTAQGIITWIKNNADLETDL